MAQNSIAIANHFVKIAMNNDSDLTLMKLIKLAYISHGWYLGLFETLLLHESVEAWRYGPVVPSVYHHFKYFGENQIRSLVAIQDFFYPTIKDEKSIDFLNKIWEVYGKFNGLQLSTLTHKPDTPWDITLKKHNGRKNESVIIPNELIMKHYKDKSKGVDD